MLRSKIAAVLSCLGTTLSVAGCRGEIVVVEADNTEATTAIVEQQPFSKEEVAEDICEAGDDGCECVEDPNGTPDCDEGFVCVVGTCVADGAESDAPTTGDTSTDQTGTADSLEETTAIEPNITPFETTDEEAPAETTTTVEDTIDTPTPIGETTFDYSDSCNAYATSFDSCYSQDEAHFFGQCEFFYKSAFDSGEECLEALEDWYSCISSLPCADIDVKASCPEKLDLYETLC